MESASSGANLNRRADRDQHPYLVDLVVGLHFGTTPTKPYNELQARACSSTVRAGDS